MNFTPLGWHKVFIADCCDILDSKRKPLNSAERKKMKGDIPYYGANGVVDFVNSFIFDEYLILMAEDGGNFSDYFTRPIAYKVSGKSWVNNHAHVLRAKKFFNQNFLFYSLEHKDIQSIINSGTRAKLNKSELEKIELLAPDDLLEQRKIADILAAVDNKVDVIARQIKATQKLKRGLMQTLFSRGVGTKNAEGRWVPHAEFKSSELGDIPSEWEIRRLEDFATENITYGVVQPGANVDGGVLLVRGGDIKDGKIAKRLRTVSTEISKQFKRTILQGGELLISLVGYPGETAVVPSQLAGANIARQAGMIRTGDELTSLFIHYYFSSSIGKSFLLGGMIGSAQQVINLKSLREVLVPVPPLAERVKICAICAAVSEKIDGLEQKKEKYQALKLGLMQKLLTGEWRVKIDEEPVSA